jgi:hypothetical protein
MGRTAATIANFFRLAFWPLAASVLIVLLLQPVYFLSLVPVAWFEALSSHTQFHLSPSSRSAAMALAIMLSACVISMTQPPSLSDLWEHLGILRSKLPLLRPKHKS